MSTLRSLLQRLVDELHSAVVGVEQSDIQFGIALVNSYFFMYFNWLILMALAVLKVDLDGGAEENGPLVGLDRSMVENVIVDRLYKETPFFSYSHT